MGTNRLAEAPCTSLGEKTIPADGQEDRAKKRDTRRKFFRSGVREKVDRKKSGDRRQRREPKV